MQDRIMGLIERNHPRVGPLRTENYTASTAILQFAGIVSGIVFSLSHIGSRKVQTSLSVPCCFVSSSSLIGRAVIYTVFKAVPCFSS